MKDLEPTHADRPGAGKIVAVTGAAGFIGGRIVEILNQQPRDDVATVRPFVRRRNEFGFEVVKLDDPVSVDRALSGCHVLIHCAFDFHDLSANLRIVKVVGRVCAARGIRLVLLSSAAVYEPFPASVFDETAPCDPAGVAYSDTKIAIEQEVLQQAGSNGLDAIILQPTTVYGPHCRQWTDTPARELLSGRVLLPDEGRGICNAVYVDDVCTAAIAAMRPNTASGERIIINGPSPITWGDFFFALRDALGTGTVSWMPPAEPQAGGKPLETASNVSAVTATAKRLASRLIKPHIRTRLKYTLQRLRSRGREIVHTPQGALLALYASRGIAATTKARKLLNWEPRVGFDEGMVETTKYLRTAFASHIEVARQRRGQAGNAQSPPRQPQGSSI